MKAEFVKPRKIYFTPGSDVPNSHLPVLLYRGVLADSVKDKAAAFHKKFKANGWSGLWTDSIYDYTHFHSNAHEVLGIAEGKVTVRLGGESGRLFRLKTGDMLIIPAGVGHQRVTKSDKGLKVIGAYPWGQSDFDIRCTGKKMPNVSCPDSDPFYGEEGLCLWRGAINLPWL
ncbi:MAG TPA: cupin domain-containing protein [Rickettsiales bacterium]|nr:cupin domain-containing protein [Rickettsiales bacterium]